jgi:DNA repair protein RecN (Recombination protein N)
VNNAYRNWRHLETELANFAKKEEQILQEIEYLKHSCQEIATLNIAENEETALAEKRVNLQLIDKLQSALKEAVETMEESNFGKLILKTQKLITQYPDNNIENINKDLDNAYISFDSAYSALQQLYNYRGQSEDNLEDVEERLYQIRSLARKYSVNSTFLHQLLEENTEKLSELERNVLSNNELSNQLHKAKDNYFILAKNLSQKRTEAIKILQEKVTSELGHLDMKKAVFKVEIATEESFAHPIGIDRVRFLVSTNPGMGLSPIDKVASGGELSRLMLALRVAILDKNPKQTIICDEIDVGISGSVADSMALRIKALSKVVQILVITHQPQVAGKADMHIFVAKNQQENRTISNIKILNKEERAMELARMISGQEITEAGLIAARELLHGNE